MRRVCIRITEQIWPGSGRSRPKETESSRVINARSNGQGKRQATLVRCDPRDLPTTECFTCETLLPLIEGKFVDIVERKHVPAIQLRPPVFPVDTERVHWC